MKKIDQKCYRCISSLAGLLDFIVSALSPKSLSDCLSVKTRQRKISATKSFADFVGFLYCFGDTSLQKGTGFLTVMVLILEQV